MADSNPTTISLMRVAPSNGNNCVVTVNTTDGQILTATVSPQPTVEEIIDALTTMLPSD